jgi:hypothetical protein
MGDSKFEWAIQFWKLSDLTGITTDFDDRIMEATANAPAESNIWRQARDKGEDALRVLGIRVKDYTELMRTDEDGARRWVSEHDVLVPCPWIGTAATVVLFNRDRAVRAVVLSAAKAASDAFATRYGEDCRNAMELAGEAVSVFWNLTESREHNEKMREDVGEAWDRISQADVADVARRAEEAISACANKDALRAAIVNMEVLRATMQTKS